MNSLSKRIQLTVGFQFLGLTALGGAAFAVKGPALQLVLVLLLIGLWVASGILFGLSGQVQQEEKEQAQEDVTAKRLRTQLMTSVRQQKEMSTRIEKLDFVSRLLKTINSSENLNQLLDVILDDTMKFFGAKSAFVMLIDEAKGDLYVERAKALQGGEIPSGRLKMGQNIPGTVAQSGLPILIEPKSKSSPLQRVHQYGEAPKADTLMCVPFRLQNKVIGVLTMEECDQGAFNQNDLEFLSIIAEEAAWAVEKARLYTRMEEMSITDVLTQLPNRRYMEKRLTEEFARAVRFSTPLSITMLDIDRFKSVNDTYGHLVGDNILRGMAEVLRENVRQTDICARYGGEEFIIILPDCDQDQAEIHAERIRRSIEKTAMFGDEQHPAMKATASFGVASFPHDQKEQEKLIDAADEALYFSKQSGRNRVSTYVQMQASQSPPPAEER